MRLFILFIILLVVISKKNFASCRINFIDDDTTHVAKINKQYFKSYLLDARDIIVAPAKWDKRKIITATSLIGISALAMTQDAKIQKLAQDNRTEFTGYVCTNLLEPWGSGVYSLSTMGLFYLQGSIFKNERSKKTALLGIKTYFVTGALVTIPKLLFNRYRPYHGETPDPMVWKGPFSGRYYRSFVSGHTTSIFALSTIVASEYKEKKFVPYIAYSIATLAALSRIHDDKHWASDIIAGAAFGYAMGKLIHNANNWKINVSPYKTTQHTGMILSYNF